MEKVTDPIRQVICQDIQNLPQTEMLHRVQAITAAALEYAGYHLVNSGQRELGRSLFLLLSETDNQFAIIHSTLKP